MRLSRILSTMKSSRTFLFWFSNEQSGFSASELESLFKLFKLEESSFLKRKTKGPFVLMDFPDEEAPRKLMSRSVLAHSCYELWGEGSTKSELDGNVQNNLMIAQPFLKCSFQVRVDTFGKNLKQWEKVDLIDSLAYLPLEGKIDLKNPEFSLHLVMYFGLDPNQAKEQPFHWYFGRWIADGRRDLATKTNLKTRKFIGNTSMDPLLSLVMVNLAMVKPTDIVFDPFVGTGSILVAAAEMGSQVLGSDIDYLMLHGKTRPTRANQVARCDGENIRANLSQYGKESCYIDVVIADASRPLWRDDFKLDAIITDPPYGIREPTERLGSSKNLGPDFKISEEHFANHFPAKQGYSLADVFCDLMNNAANRLKLGGRLVFWIPISRIDYHEEKLPRNACFKLIFNVEQVLTTFASRRLVVYEKVRESDVLSVTEIDRSALMYRCRFFETNRESKKNRKLKTKACSTYGRHTKRGQLVPDDSSLEKVLVNNL